MRTFGRILFAAMALTSSVGLGMSAADDLAASSPASGPSSSPANRLCINRLPFLAVPKASAAGMPKPDLSDALWQSAVRIDLVEGFQGLAPKYATTCLAFCTDDALYLGFRCQEPAATNLALAGPPTLNDHVEIFLEPFHETSGRANHQIAVDAQGRVETFRRHIYPGFFGLHDFDEPWQPKLQAGGVRQADAWTVVVKIPFDQLKLPDHPRQTLWRMNVHRYRPERPGEGLMTWSWSPTANGRFHSAARMGYILVESMADGSAREEAAKAAPCPPDQPSDWPAFLAEVDKAIADLGSADETVRATAVEKLKQLTAVGPATPLAVKDKLESARGDLARASKPSAAQAADELWAWVGKYMMQNDPDPPSDRVKKTMDPFREASFTDAAGRKLAYRIMAPAALQSGRKYPLVVYLHGSGGAGSDNWHHLEDGPVQFARDEVRGKYEFFLIAPQSPLRQPWVGSIVSATSPTSRPERPNSMQTLLELIDDVVATQPIDPDRIYISGYSMGAYGTWGALMKRPGFFAAGAPMCGSGDERHVDRVGSTPVWIFHGTQDARVKVELGRKMYEALKKAGGNVQYTEDPDAGHVPVLLEKPEFYRWLFAQKRGAAPASTMP